MAARVNRREARERERVAFLASVDGVRASDVSVEQLFECLKQIATECGGTVEIGNASGSVRTAALKRGSYCVSLSWKRVYSNDLRNSDLLIEGWNGPTAIRNTTNAFLRDDDGIYPLCSHRFVFDQIERGDTGWREDAENGRAYSPAGIAEFAAKLLLSFAYKGS